MDGFLYLISAPCIFLTYILEIWVKNHMNLMQTWCSHRCQIQAIILWSLGEPLTANSSSNETKEKNEGIAKEPNKDGKKDSREKVNIPEIVRKIEIENRHIPPSKQFCANNICSPPNMCTPTTICPQLAPNIINSIMPQHTAQPLGRLHKNYLRSSNRRIKSI